MGFTLKEVINKIKKLRYKYKQEKDKTRKSANGVSKKWKFFDDVDKFLMTKHNVTPPCLVETMSMAETEEDLQDRDAGESSCATGIGNIFQYIKLSNYK